MGAGFVLTGLLLVITLAAAAVLRWESRPGHAIGLAVAAVAMVGAIGLGSIVDLRAAVAAEPDALPSISTLVAEEPAEEATATATLEVSWLDVEGDEIHAAIPWPADAGGVTVREGVPTAVDVDMAELDLLYSRLGLLASDGRTYLVQTRAGWPARVELDGGYVTVSFS
ncbi:hypothetical protein [Demequina rhizosphaerae]|uniref:hypothetical protein n=1 Tax=Demequina rhizosphaerae TaxID=1638985 RepID=UPI000A806DB9|nr:hypothetical protein [Demequina rhizosphaerae]